MKNYIGYAWIVTLFVVLFCIAGSYIPSEAIERLGLRPIDILSDLNRGNTTEQLDGLDGEAGAGLHSADDGSIVIVETVKTADHTMPTEHGDTTRTDSTAQRAAPRPANDSTVVIHATALSTDKNPITDYSAGGNSLEPLFAALRRDDGVVRIGVLGDSFIEGDLLTVDLRDMLQQKLGGSGVGFVPITSQTASFRQSVVHTFGGWSSTSILSGKSGPFWLSGQHFTPTEEGSFVEYRATPHKRSLSSFGSATLLYVSTATSKITVTVDDSLVTSYTTDPSPQVQKLVTNGSMHSIRYTVNDIEGFSAYGTMLNGTRGVSVDNFSLRGNPGHSLQRLNKQVCHRIEELAPYDLLVLEYGLNVVESSVVNYNGYRDQMLAVVSHLRECFPNVPLLLMSVGDRSTRVDGEWVTMPGILAMVATQKQIAARSGMALWNTYQAMISQGGMPTYVTNGWAAKDYTHIGARGGKKIAAAMFDAIISARELSDSIASRRALYQQAPLTPREIMNLPFEVAKPEPTK